MAKDAAEEIGARLCLGDRHASITIKRAWNSLSRWKKLRLVFEYLWGSIRGISQEELEKLDECMKTRGVLELLKEEFAGTFPEMLHTLCTERDMYMAYQLRRQGKFCVTRKNLDCAFCVRLRRRISFTY